MAEFPRIVVEVEQGIVAAVYMEGQSVLFAVVDADQEAVGEDAVSLDYTQPQQVLPVEVREAIEALLPA